MRISILRRGMGAPICEEQNGEYERVGDDDGEAARVERLRGRIKELRALSREFPATQVPRIADSRLLKSKTLGAHHIVA